MSTAARPGGLTLEIPVRWGDMDAFQHVNNTVYFRYCESARIAYFEALRLDEVKSGPSEGPALVAANLNFRRQMRYPGTVRVEIRVTSVSRRSFTHGYVLTNAEDGQVVADGSSVCVLVDYADNRTLPLSAAVLGRIAEIEGRPELAAERDAG